ncbi:XapX domain-containing protein [Bosea sp. CS1GBMeth4]|uniref:XapX domain-containing protein n=1 Tax=Bosea sp. CS1GBMeth4 TaxID=1892849 RepID=UPI001645865F|nr:XapX domain-containing protein [Bosea sp. CS1GBMeth4]
MKLYLVSLGAGLLVGIVYSLLNVRSPAPPAIALIGLLGILVGEQIVPVARRVIAGETLSLGWLRSECGEHVFGALPSRGVATPADSSGSASSRS